MKTYTMLSLNEVIESLRELPEGARVRGFAHPILHGDRGYYERSALTPGTRFVTDAKALALDLQEQEGDSIPGYKGGDYYVRRDLPVAYAYYGDTGPYIAGFELDTDSGDYIPVLVAERWY